MCELSKLTRKQKRVIVEPTPGDDLMLLQGPHRQ